MNNFTKFAFSGLAGLLLTAAFPRIGASPLAAAALVPLLLAIRTAAPGEAFRLGWIAGMAHALTLTYWLVHTLGTYGGLPIWVSVPLLGLLAAYLALYPAAFAATLAALRIRPGLLPIAAAAVWTGLEYLRAHLLTGFPWALLGYSQYRRLHLIQISDIVGVYGVSFLLVAINASISLAILAGWKRPWAGRMVSGKLAATAAAAAALATAAVAGYGAWRMAEIDRISESAPVVRAAAIQGNIEQAVKWDPAYQIDTVDRYLALSLAAMADRPDLIVWPETAAPFYFSRNRPLTERVLAGIREAGVHFAVGAPAFERDGEETDLYNSAFLIRPDGRIAGRYDKVHLVPFGEYVPLERFLPFVDKLVTQVGDFGTGRKGEVLRSGDHRLGVLICYEAIFPGLARAAVQNGAGLLVNITNDAWYGTSSAPYQHFSMAALRAVETRRGLIRAANTGISGFVDPVGRIDGTTGLFETTVSTRTLPVLTIETPYAKIGDLFARLCLAGIPGMGIACIARRRRKTK